MGLALLLFILIPIAEVWTAIQVAHHIGWLATIAVIVVISAFGPRLVRREGTGVWRRARHRLEEGEIPGREAIDGVLLLIAGGLLAFPGFITGVLGLLLLIPPVRRLVRVASGAWLARKVRRSGVTVRTSVNGSWPATVSRSPSDHGRVTTAESHPVEHPRGALGRPADPEPPGSPGPPGAPGPPGGGAGAG